MVPVYVRVWEYQVPAEHVEAFVAAYGADGDWARLFRRGRGYGGTDLYRAADGSARFLTVDRWDDEAAWAGFVARWRTESGALGAELAGLTSANRVLVEHET